MKISKRMKETAKLVDKAKKYGLEEAIAVLKKSPHPKFNETVDISFKLNVDPKASQSIRGTVALPHGTGKNVRVAVFCKGEAESKAKAAGAEFVGSAELVEKVQGGWCDFDVAIATPEMMRDMGRLGKVLGPRGLMPNPKAGTVTEDVAKAIKEVKAGKVEFRMDKQGNMHVPVGKISFEEKQLSENAVSLIDAVGAVRVQGLKGDLVKGISISSTMGPGLRLDAKALIKK
ncbi:MAG: 50S ribosomal protein L1 [Candidatus Omnitrophica bacterium]|nr:50S ribosomal protein L1 [Candidatus Omnitrophota bacterium]